MNNSSNYPVVSSSNISQRDELRFGEMETSSVLHNNLDVSEEVLSSPGSRESIIHASLQPISGYHQLRFGSRRRLQEIPNETLASERFLESRLLRGGNNLFRQVPGEDAVEIVREIPEQRVMYQVPGESRLRSSFYWIENPRPNIDPMD